MTKARAFDRTVIFDYFLAILELETEATGAWHGMNAQNQLYAFINKNVQDFRIISKSRTFWSRHFAYL